MRATDGAFGRERSSLSHKGDRSEVDGVNVKAVLAGVATDVFSSTLVGIVEAVILVAVAARTGNASAAHLLQLKSRFAAEFSGLLGTTLCTGLGGYVSVRVSRVSNLGNALIVGTISLLLGGLVALYGHGLVPSWKIVSGLILTLPAAVTGGYLALGSGSQTLASSSV